MLRIAETTLPDSGITESAFLTRRDSAKSSDDDLVGGSLKVGVGAPEQLFESVIYKLSYHRFGRARTAPGKDVPFFDSEPYHIMI